MIDLEKRLNKIEKNSYENAKRELKILKDENDSNINEKVEKRLEQYKNELNIKYSKNLEKLAKDFNKEVCDYQINERKKIKSYKESLINEIRAEIEDELREFVNSNDYRDYLFKNIEKTLSLVNSNDCIVSVTERDYYKYKDEILSRFNAKVVSVSNDKIGGCIVQDNQNKVLIDNMLETNANERIDKINL